jgi:hypothetical protein
LSQTDCAGFVPWDSFNQMVVSYNATKEDKVDALKTKKAQVEVEEH